MFDVVVVFVETGLLRRPVARERQSDRGSVQIRGRAILGGAFPKAETPLRRRFRRRARRTAPTFHIRFGRPTSVRAEEMGAEAGVIKRADGTRLLSLFCPSDEREAEEMSRSGRMGASKWADGARLLSSFFPSDEREAKEMGGSGRKGASETGQTVQGFCLRFGRPTGVRRKKWERKGASESGRKL